MMETALRSAAACLILMSAGCASEMKYNVVVGNAFMASGAAMAASGGAGYLYIQDLEERSTEERQEIVDRFAMALRMPSTEVEPSDYPDTHFAALAVAGGVLILVGAVIAALPRTIEMEGVETSTAPDPRGNVWR